MAYKFYRALTIPCPNCQCCAAHSDYRHPTVMVRRTYHVRNDDNTVTDLTEEEYDAWDGSR